MFLLSVISSNDLKYIHTWLILKHVYWVKICKKNYLNLNLSCQAQIPREAFKSKRFFKKRPLNHLFLFLPPKWDFSAFHFREEKTLIVFSVHFFHFRGKKLCEWMKQICFSLASKKVLVQGTTIIYHSVKKWKLSFATDPSRRNCNKKFLFFDVTKWPIE